MTSNQNLPGLVLRAAEHLGAERPQVPERRGQAQDQRESAGLPKRASRGLAGKSITISPTTLAMNGFHLLSSGSTEASLAVEEYRTIRRSVMTNIDKAKSSPGEKRLDRAVLVTSARPGDGKTFTSLNLALSLAQSGQRHVLLVDADAWHRSLINCLGLKTDIGWVDWLSRDDLTPADIVLNTNIPNLSVMPSGKPTENLADLVGGAKMLKLLKDLNDQDPEMIMILDSLPCLVSNVPSILAEIAGQVVFVVAANETGREEVQSSLQHLGGARTVSLVLNKGDPLMREQFSRYHYHYYRNE